MKQVFYFYIAQEQIQVLKVSGLKKRVLSEADTIQTRDSSDEQISQHLKTWIKQKRINLRSAQFGLVIPRSSIILRQLTLPSHLEDEIKSMVDLQIVKHIPYDRGEVEMDFQILEKMEDGYTKVLVVVIPQENAMRFWNIFSKAGIGLQWMTISSVGLWLLYKNQEHVPKQLGAIIDFEDGQSEICVCTKDYWVNSREIPFGLERILKNGYEEFFKQWHLTLDNKPDNSVGRIDIVTLAQSVKLPMTVQEELSNGLRCQVRIINVDQFLTMMKNAGSKSWAALAGVALSMQRPPIDLVPQEVRSVAERRFWQKEILITAIAFVCAGIILACAMSMNWIKGRSYLDQMNQMIKDKKVKANRIAQEMNEVQSLENILKNRFIFARWVDAIYPFIPKGISLVSINVTDGSFVSIQGTSSVSGDINLLQNKMVNSPLFSNVSLDFVNKRVTQEGELNYFKMTAIFRGQL